MKYRGVHSEGSLFEPGNSSIRREKQHNCLKQLAFQLQGRKNKSRKYENTKEEWDRFRVFVLLCFRDERGFETILSSEERRTRKVRFHFGQI